MIAKRTSLLLPLLFAALAAACAPQTETVKLFEDRAATPESYGRLLVVDVASDQDFRRDFENEIVARLRRAGTDAIPSHTVLRGNEGLLQQDISRAGRENGADGILITHLVSIETSVDSKEGREEIVRTCRQGNPVDYFLYDNVVLKEPDSVRVALTVVVVTNLYDSAAGDRVWSIQSTCFKKASLPEVFVDEAKAIVRQLQIDELI